MHKVGEFYLDDGPLYDYVEENEKIMTIAIITEDSFGVARTYVFNRQHHTDDLRLEVIELTKSKDDNR